jgi:hypothetical protein
MVCALCFAINMTIEYELKLIARWMKIDAIFWNISLLLHSYVCILKIWIVTERQ